MNTEQLEQIATELCEIFEVYAPPIPIELMLQHPRENMWEEVDVTQLSGSFLSVKERFSPRMSLARLLVRHIVHSEWGSQNDLEGILDDDDYTNAFARMLLMPRDMVTGLTESMRNPTTMSTHFEVPESDAEQRLLELV